MIKSSEMVLSGLGQLSHTHTHIPVSPEDGSSLLYKYSLNTFAF